MSTRHGLQIRAPDAGDAAGLAAFFLENGRSIGAGDLVARLDRLAGFPGATLIAQEWGPPSGLIGLHWYPDLLAGGLTARVAVLLVAPDARRRGIARLLLKAASQAARMAGCDTLECFPADEHAQLQSFLLATGFIQSGARFTRPLRKKP